MTTTITPRLALTIAILLLGTVMLGACSNTLDGAGRDIERAGEKVQQTF